MTKAIFMVHLDKQQERSIRLLGADARLPVSQGSHCAIGRRKAMTEAAAKKIVRAELFPTRSDCTGQHNFSSHHSILRRLSFPTRTAGNPSGEKLSTCHSYESETCCYNR